MIETYLDNSATTRVCPPAAQKMMELLTEAYGNPSSLHSKGLAAEREIQSAREILAQQLSCQPEELIFTSGGTEANNLALLGAANAKKRMGKRIIVSAVEHSSVLDTARELEKQGFDVVYLQPDIYGKVPREAIFEAITPDTILISLQMVNNEMGAIQPVEAVASALKRAKSSALFHVDAVQAFGKIPVKPHKLGIHLLTVTAHKIHGPKGVGALFLSKGTRILPRTFGGEQEKKIRPGTENAAGICGFGAAIQALPDLTEAYAKVQSLRDRCVAGLQNLEGVVLNSAPDALPYIVNFSVVGIRSETMLHFLSAEGIYVSSGSACAKGHKSHVLVASRLPEERISSALRVSFCHENTEEEVDRLLSVLKQGISTLVRAK